MKISFASSVPYNKNNPKIINASSNGFIVTENLNKFFVTDKIAQHSAIAGKDVKINNVEGFKLPERVNSNNDVNAQLLISSPTFNQASNPYCVLMPFLHQIQAQLDFPIDATALLACLEEDMNNIDRRFVPRPWLNFVDELAKNYGNTDEGKQTLSAYVKLTTLLFIDICIPISKGVQNGCQDYETILNQQYVNKKCDDACSDKYKFTTIVRENKINNNNDDIKQYIDQGIPLGISVQGRTAQLLFLYDVIQDAGYAPNGIPITLNDLTNYPDAVLQFVIAQLNIPRDKLLDGSIGHVITVVGYTDLDDGCVMFHIKNSWGTQGDIYYKSCSNLYDELYASAGATSAIMNFRVKVTKCDDATDCEPDIGCQRFGFDKNKEVSAKDECPCECDSVEQTNNVGLSVSKKYIETFEYKNNIYSKCVCVDENDEVLICPPDHSVDPNTCDCVQNKLFVWCDCGTCPENGESFLNGNIAISTSSTDYLYSVGCVSPIMTIDLDGTLTAEEIQVIVNTFKVEQCEKNFVPIDCKSNDPPNTPTTTTTTTTTTPTPPPPYGVCCDPAGQCSQLYADQADCENAGGTWYDNVTCEDITCTPPPESI